MTLTLSTMAVIALIALAGGLVRGMSGFGGSMVMMPLLAMVSAPKFIVAPVLLLEAFAAAPMLRGALRLAQFRVVAPLCLATFATVPVGAQVLLHADPLWLRHAIALLVMAFSIVLLCGIRYKGPHSTPMSVGLGLLSGVLLGATGIGGPPMIVYLLSGPAPGAITRANLTLVVMAISVAALSVLWLHGALQLDGPAPLWLLAPGYVAGIFAGARLFACIDERRFRQATLGLLIAVSLMALIA